MDPGATPFTAKKFAARNNGTDVNFFRPQIERMDGYTPGEQPQAGKFIKLNTNENPYPPSPAVPAAIMRAAESGLQRYPDPLATAFRLRAGEVLDVDPEWILCGNGSDDILTILTRALVGDGQWLRFPSPSYLLYQTLADLQGAAAEQVAFSADWQLTEAFYQGRDDLRLVLLPNPNSPSGTLVEADAILELAQRVDCPVLIDEAYVDFSEQSCLQLVQQDPRIMVCRTLSKSYGLAGLRFGFLVAQPVMIDALRKVKDSYNCDALSIAGATAAIDDQAWFADNRQKILTTRSHLAGELRRLGYEVTDSSANFVWCYRHDQSVEQIYRRLKEQRVLIRYMNYPGWGEGLRISVGTDEQIAVCLQLLADVAVD